MPYDAQTIAAAVEADCRAEADVLLCALALHFGDPAGDLGQLLRPPFDPATFRDLLRVNKLALFLGPQRRLLAAVSPDLASWIDVVRLRTLAMNRRALATAAALQPQFDAAGLAAVHFKGPLQQQQIHGSPCMKPTGDIDILVARSDFHVAARLLARAGFRADTDLAHWWRVFLGEQHFEGDARHTTVDLHHKVQQPGSPSPYGPEAFMARAVPMEFEGQTYPVPCSVDRCLLTAMTIVKSAYGHEPSGGYVVDMRASLDVLTSAERTALPVLAAQHGLTETVAFATCCVDALFPARSMATGPNPLPRLSAPVLRKLVLTPWDRSLVWPRRRQVLRALCGPSAPRYLREMLRTVVSEGYVQVLMRIGRRHQASS